MGWARLRWLLPLLAVLGALVGLTLTWPVAGEVIDGGPGCTSCGSWTLSVIGLRAHDGAVFQPTLGTAIGLLAGGLMAVLLVAAYRSRSRRRAALLRSRTE